MAAGPHVTPFSLGALSSPAPRRTTEEASRAAITGTVLSVHKVQPQHTGPVAPPTPPAGLQQRCKIGFDYDMKRHTWILRRHAGMRVEQPELCPRLQEAANAEWPHMDLQCC